LNKNNDMDLVIIAYIVGGLEVGLIAFMVHQINKERKKSKIYYKPIIKKKCK